MYEVIPTRKKRAICHQPRPELDPLRREKKQMGMTSENTHQTVNFKFLSVPET